ncbi:LysM peptidoglycan-binding domain-containing protein [Ferrimonas senticii]|uniref:LysM peptidoglycan-binding domain-containing protein n=1 Tax=Ferrimonas senticii TaxID=394566 RepID=UPI000424070B|nr:LysM domain-containing protein [Ferrimonas senticii]
MKRLAVFLAVALVGSAWADTLTLKPGHPDTYVVKKGDTLWDISGLFLDDPWRWPTLWGANPQIANPHLIYPGDQLTLVYIDGKPRLVRKASVRMSPEMGIQPKGGAIPAVPLSIIEPYLSFQQVLTEEQLVGIPRVMGGERQAVGYASGDVLFVDGELQLGQRYGVYRKGRVLRDVDGKTLLGLEMELTAAGQVTESGKISRVTLASSDQEVLPGQWVMPISDAAMLPAYFQPHAAPAGITGQIIASDAKAREMGPFQVAIVNRGSDDGAEIGQVYAIHKDNEEILVTGEDDIPYRDQTVRRAYDKVMALTSDGRSVELPMVYSGELMLFKTYNKVSMGLIVNGRNPVRVEDHILAPSPMVFGSKRG